MKEHEFILKLQTRAKEQEQLMKNMPYSEFFLFISQWLSDHPWRYLIPLAFIVSLFFRSIFGAHYTNFILWLFSRL